LKAILKKSALSWN